MQKYYFQRHLKKANFSNKDLLSVIIIIVSILAVFYFYTNLNNTKNIKITEQYYVNQFATVPSLEQRFNNKKYDIAISKILLEDTMRSLKNKFKDLNASINSFKQDLLRQQAMNDIILMLSQIKNGNLDNFNVSKMQQAILEAGYGNIDSKILKKALQDYQLQLQQRSSLELKLTEQQRKTKEKIVKDSKDTVIFASDIAKEIAEEEIQGFIENLSIIARVGTFVVNKVKE